ncbi:hypothetical protein JTE90_004383, partial [Oedothorax gibbosus]
PLDVTINLRRILLVLRFTGKSISKMSCVAFGCYNNSSKKIAGITFHRFPKGEILRKEWLQVYVTFTNGRDCRVKWRCLAQNKVKLAAASSQLYATRLLHSTFWNASSSG